MAKYKEIKVIDLLVNPENYRFESVSSQKEAIDEMVSNQKEKLYVLAKHILENGLNPNDKIQVTESSAEKGKYIVVEGNRRCVALKLTLNPNLLDESNALKKKFAKLKSEAKSNLIKVVECTVYDSPSEADKWIRIKHAGLNDGVGTDRWTGLQVDRFDEASEGKSSVALQTVKLLQTSKSVPKQVKDNLSRLRITNLNRLIGDPDFRDFLGVSINNGVMQSEIDEKEVVKGLTKVAKDLLNPQFGVSKIYTKVDRKKYLESFKKKDTPDKTKKASKPWQFNGSASSPSAQLKPRKKLNPKDRNKLIPSRCSIAISNAKANSIYHELQKLDITKFTNAGAVLFRVFVELSIDTYIEEHKLISALSAAKSGMNFQQKAQMTANHLEQKKAADAAICKGIRVNIKNSHDLLGLDTWHAYVHSNKFRPTAPNLNATWDGVEEFMVILWGHIK